MKFELNTTTAEVAALQNALKSVNKACGTSYEFSPEQPMESEKIVGGVITGCINDGAVAVTVEFEEKFITELLEFATPWAIRLLPIAKMASEFLTAAKNSVKEFKAGFRKEMGAWLPHLERVEIARYTDMEAHIYGTFTVRVMSDGRRNLDDFHILWKPDNLAPKAAFRLMHESAEAGLRTTVMETVGDPTILTDEKALRGLIKERQEAYNASILNDCIGTYIK